MLTIRKAAMPMTIACCVALASCNSSTTPSPTPTATPSNISGDYTGTTQDAQSGGGAAAGTLAQNGNNAGGAITIHQTSGTVLTAQISLTINSSNAVSGAIVIDYPSGTTCTFSTNGTYNTATNVLSGSYTAVTNCTGDTGTYSLTQQCTDTVTAGDRRVSTTPKC